MAKAAIEKADKPQPSALAVAGQDELASVLDGIQLSTDGLDELGSEDIKIAVKVANFKGTTKDGDPILPNVFYDTVDETTSKTLDAVLLTFHKSNEWREFDQTASKTVTHCRSFDRVHAETAEGTQRSCEGCPDKEWTMGPDGKRTRRCSTVYNVVAVERLTQRPFILRARKTAVEPFKQHLNRYFIGRRPTPKGLANYPLFAFQTNISLKMENKGGTSWAVPVFELGPVQSREQILACEANAKFFRERMMPMLAKVSDADAIDDDAPSAPDTSFDPSAFAQQGSAVNAPSKLF